MAPYVALPDAGDQARYAGAPLGHWLLRTPIVFGEIGLDHFRAGHGLHAREESIFRHLNFVFHEGMPIFDLQLVQTFELGLERFRAYTFAIEEASTPKARSQQRRIDWILPNASSYRQRFLEPGGWIDQCAAFDYSGGDEVADFLRPEFTSLVRFVNYCADTFEPWPTLRSAPTLPWQFADLATRALRKTGTRESQE